MAFFGNDLGNSFINLWSLLQGNRLIYEEIRTKMQLLNFRV